MLNYDYKHDWWQAMVTYPTIFKKNVWSYQSCTAVLTPVESNFKGDISSNWCGLLLVSE